MNFSLFKSGIEKAAYFVNRTLIMKLFRTDITKKKILSCNYDLKPDKLSKCFSYTCSNNLFFKPVYLQYRINQTFLI